MAQDPFNHRTYAGERAAKDAQSTNEHFRAAGQAAILISGGAATAVLAYSASEKHPLTIEPRSLALALSLYAIGVFLGALMLMLLAFSIERWMFRWEVIARENVDRGTGRALLMKSIASVVFALSIVCFLAGSLVLASGMRARDVYPPPVVPIKDANVR